MVKLIINSIEFEIGFYCVRNNKILVLLDGNNYYVCAEQILKNVNKNSIILAEIDNFIPPVSHIPGCPTNIPNILKDVIIADELVRTDYYRQETTPLTENIIVNNNSWSFL